MAEEDRAGPSETVVALAIHAVGDAAFFRIHGKEGVGHGVVPAIGFVEAVAIDGTGVEEQEIGFAEGFFEGGVHLLAFGAELRIEQFGLRVSAADHGVDVVVVGGKPTDNARAGQVFFDGAQHARGEADIADVAALPSGAEQDGFGFLGGGGR